MTQHEKPLEEKQDKAEQPPKKQEKPEEKKEQEKHECREEEYKAVAQMVQAEFENYKKRMEQRYEENARFSSSGILKQLLPFMDSLDDALRHIEKSEKFEKKDAVEGMESLRKQMLAILKANGIEEIRARGKFNPELHDCVSAKSEREKEDGEIICELRKGYSLHGKVLRPAMVEVNRKQEDKKEEKNEVSKNE